MPLETYTITNFGGLNEVDPADDVGIENAQALQDVTWDQSTGSIRQRDGYTTFSPAESAAFTRQIDFIYSNDRQVIGTRPTATEAYTSAGSSIATGSFGGFDMVRFGTPSASFVYITVPGDYPQYWTGAAFSQRTSLPKGNFVNVQPNDNRLVMDGTAGGPGGATSSSSHLWFSDPGAPETWNSNNYVQLTPGDGEYILGIESWGNQLFVFKETKMFVFYGNSTDAAGNPVFNYRTVSLEGAAAFYDGMPAGVGPEGVYYVGRNGLYWTTGDRPMRVSNVLTPVDSTVAGVSYVSNRLFWLCTGLTHTYVFDTRVGEWTKWALGQNSPGVLEYPGTLGLFGGTAGNYIYKLTTASTTDNGTNISSHWTSGLSNLGYEGEKKLKYIDVWGTGTVSLSVASNFNAPANASTLTLGSSTVDRTRYTTAAAGHLFGLKLASVNGAAWKVHRVTLHFDPAPTAQHDRT